MKHINVVFEDKDFSKLVSKKGSMSWRDLILSLIDNKIDNKIETDELILD